MKTFLKFSGFIIIKWLLFYAYQFAEGGDVWSFSKTNWEGLFLTTFMFLGLPVLEIIVLFFPAKIALRKKGWTATLLLLGMFGLEFFIGWFITNQHVEIWMIFKIALSVGLFLLLFRKQLKNIYSINDIKKY